MTFYQRSPMKFWTPGSTGLFQPFPSFDSSGFGHIFFPRCLFQNRFFFFFFFFSWCSYFFSVHFLAVFIPFFLLRFLNKDTPHSLVFGPLNIYSLSVSLFSPLVPIFLFQTDQLLKHDSTFLSYLYTSLNMYTSLTCTHC